MKKSHNYNMILSYLNIECFYLSVAYQLNYFNDMVLLEILKIKMGHVIVPMSIQGEVSDKEETGGLHC